MKRRMLISGLLSIGLSSFSAGGAILTHTLAITNVYTTTGANIQNNPTQAQVYADFDSGTTYIYRVAIYSSLSGLGANEAYGDELFNLTLSSQDSRLPSNVGSARANWVPNSPSDGFDSNGVAVPELQKNTDAGASSTDLQALTVVINNDPNNYNNVYDDTAVDNLITDNRVTLANPGPTRIGSIDIVVPAFSLGWIALSGGQYATLNTNPSSPNYMQFGATNYIPDNFDRLFESGYNSEVFPLWDITLPEPAALSLLGLGAMGLIARRRKA